MLLDRHRVARLIELSAMERAVKGPERLLREEEVKLFIKAAYDDATDAARAEFMKRVQTMPTSAWPWSAVQVTTSRGGGGVSLGKIVAVPKPTVATVPAALVLLRGQAASVDADPGDRLPDAGMPGAAEWEPLFKALESWDTAALKTWIGPQGWVSPMGTVAGGGNVPEDMDDDAATAGAPAGGGTTPAGQGAADEPAGGGGGRALEGTQSGGVPAPQGEVSRWTGWRHPAVLAAGAAAVVTVGVVIYRVGRRRSLDRLSAEIRRQGEAP